MKEDGGFYDTNVLIAYLFKEEEKFSIAKIVLEKHTVRAISIISIHEIHWFSTKFGIEEKFVELKKFLHKLFIVEPLEQSVCTLASHLRKNYNLPEIDSLILATAIHFEYEHFYTFGSDFKELNNKTIKRTQIHYLGRE